MDELHARVRAFRSPPTEMNLAKQPYPELDDSDQAQRQSEANVVEMPNRQANEASASSPTEQSQGQRATTKRKQGAAAKRKPTAVQQKAFPFRQLRDGHQQPYIDELRRLEAQAERINQLLADRKRKQALAEQSAGLTTPKPLAETERSASKKKAPKSARQSTRQASRSPQREVPPMPAQDDDTNALEAQAERIKQLLQELEAALAEGSVLPDAGAIEHQGEHQKTGDLTSTATPTPASPITAPSVESFASSTYRYGVDSLPFTVNQTEPITGATDPKAQQEAADTAQALRSLASREPMESAIATPQYDSRRHASRSRSQHVASSQPSLRRYGLRLRQMLQMPQQSLDRIGDAVLWVVLAAAIRVGARLLLVQFPALAPVLLVFMFAPAAVAVYLAMYVPKAGFVSIYRLFLIMLGLLLGGRF